MSSNKQAVLATMDLSIGYQTKATKNVLAKQINMELHKGSLAAIVGPNGVGKSTLIKTLSQTLKPIAGEVLLENQSILKLSQTELAKQLSVVLTKPAASGNLSVIELVALGRHPYTDWIGRLTSNDHQSINNALEVTQTTHLKNNKCYTLSDGQMQRVFIARTLAQDTPLIILDEPTTHLDLNHKSQILKLLKTLAENGKTVIYSTHDIALALEICNQLLVIHKQRVINGTPDQIIESGVLEELFPKDRVTFDSKNKRFTLNK